MPGGLRPGSDVDIAGVRVGKVTSVRVRTDLPQTPAEVTMLLDTQYDLKLPSDALVLVETAGILGAPFAEIEIDSAKGQPVSDNTTLKTTGPKGPTTQDLINCLSNLAEHKRCDLSSKRQIDVNQRQKEQ
jgi:ABC-type transporter Mla subunit MlaD